MMPAAGAGDVAADEDLVLASASRVAATMLPELPAIARGITEHVVAALPEFGKPTTAKILLATVQVATSGLIDGLMRGVPIALIQLSTEVIENTRAMVREGIDIDTFMRGYQVGAAYWWELWAGAVERHCSDLSLAFQIMNRGTAFLFEWLQMMTDRISAAYHDEAERLARAGSLARLAAVQRALTDDNVDVVAASQRLGYELRGNHVALVLSREDGSEAALTVTAGALAGMMTKTRPLIVPVDADTVWCWVPADAAHELSKLLAAVRCGQGRPGKGLDGFRRTHREAREALRVAQIAGSPAPTLTRFAQVELAALCSVDPEVCCDFVETELGQLAADTPPAQRLRETLRAFYDADSNFRATAARLGLHHNTIRYRLTQAEELLGRSIAERRLHLELALHLAEQLNVRTPRA